MKDEPTDDGPDNTVAIDDDADDDNDGLLDQEELELGTNPEKPDTDGDGVNDLDETENGTDPLILTLTMMDCLMGRSKRPIQTH